jgi:hypothetical protein
MSRTIASDVVRKGLDVFLENVSQQTEPTPDEARDLVLSCAIPAVLLEQLWELLQRFLDRGMEGRQFTFLVKEYLDVSDLGIKALDAAAERIKSADLPEDEKAAGLAQVETARRRSVQWHDELAALVRRLVAPRRAIEPASLPPSGGPGEAQGYLSLDELTDRLLSRKDV